MMNVLVFFFSTNCDGCICWPRVGGKVSGAKVGWILRR